MGNPIRDEWQSDDGAVRLILGDCLGCFVESPPSGIDCLLTDPPYCSGGYLEAQKNTKAQGLRGATVSADGFKWFASDNMSTMGLVWLLRSTLICCRECMNPNRSAMLFTDWRMVPHLAPALESSGLRFRNTIIWDKGHAGLGVGFKPAYECVLEFCNGSTEYQSACGQNVIRSARVNAAEKEHNAQKPVELLEELLGVVTAPGWFVADAFMGSGSTGVACVRTGRRFVGYELDPSNWETAVRRVRAELERFPLFEQASRPRQLDLIT